MSRHFISAGNTSAKKKKPGTAALASVLWLRGKGKNNILRPIMHIMLNMCTLQITELVQFM